MIVEFTISTYGQTEEETNEEMDITTSAFLVIAGGRFWECVEDFILPDPSWVPGFGSRGPPQGYKAYRKFINRDERREVKFMGEPMTPTPEAPAEETPVEAPEETPTPEEETETPETPTEPEEDGS